MANVYAVRCNFARKDLEDKWNDWYSGPKLTQMLDKPLFRSGQRFRAVGLDTHRQYLALWVVESPQAFETPEYKNDWGFFEWQPHITDWSRDLFDAPGDIRDTVRTGEGERLYLASFEGSDAAAARGLIPQLKAARPEAMWLEAAGLDRKSPVLGIWRLGASAADPAPLSGIAGLRETVFSPISRFATSET